MIKLKKIFGLLLVLALLVCANALAAIEGDSMGYVEYFQTEEGLNLPAQCTTLEIEGTEYPWYTVTVPQDCTTVVIVPAEEYSGVFVPFYMDFFISESRMDYPEDYSLSFELDDETQYLKVPVIDSESSGKGYALEDSDYSPCALLSFAYGEVKTEVSGVAINKESVSFFAGDSATLTASVAPASITDAQYTWRSSNTDVATVKGNGASCVVTCVGYGRAEISVSAGVKDQSEPATASCTVLGYDAGDVPVSKMALKDASLDVIMGSSGKLEPVFTPANATHTNVSWQVGDASILSIAADGTITPLKNGKTTVTATSEDGQYQAKATVYVYTWDETCPPKNAGGAYELDSEADMLWFAQLVNQSQKNDADAVLKKNITISTADWAGIGVRTTSTSGNIAYTGTFDGNGCTLTLSSQSVTLSHNGGVINSLGDGGAVKNLKVEADLAGITWGPFGGIVGVTNGKTSIENCSFSGKILSDVGMFAAIVGDTNGTTKISNCINTAKLTSNSASGSNIGGIVARNFGAPLSGCVNTGNITSASTSKSAYIGGIVGYSRDSGRSITNCYNTGTISAAGAGYVGGIAGGHQYSSLALTNCYNAGSVNGAKNADSVFGGTSLKNVNITNCYGVGTTKATVKTLAEMQSADFVELLGSSYRYKRNSTPILSWQGEGDDPNAVVLPDLNNDGYVNVQDAVKLLRHIAKLETLSDALAAQCDLNSDSNVNVRDAVIMLRTIAQLDTAK